MTDSRSSPRGAKSDTDDDVRARGADTLRVWNGTVVGSSGDDVFVELGPRMQGVVSARQFEERPREGEVFEFTLRGQEEGLWILARREEKALSDWENIEAGSLVQARVTGENAGGLELKIGPLHAFMPKGQTGLPREQKPDILLGKTITCDVIEVDDERQRVVVSRKSVMQREKKSQLQRIVGSLRPGQVVHGRVSRVESYGAFVDIGRGLEGLVHVSDLSVERVENPSEVVKKGDHVSAKVLSIKHGGKRIGLGLKQMEANPWSELEKYVQVHQIVAGRVMHLANYGAFVEVLRGVEGLLHVSQMGIDPARSVNELFSVGDELSLRVLAMDCERERLSLSLMHMDGKRITPEEASQQDYFREVLKEAGEDEIGTNVGDLMRRALDAEQDSAPDAPEQQLDPEQ